MVNGKELFLSWKKIILHNKARQYMETRDKPRLTYNLIKLWPFQDRSTTRTHFCLFKISTGH